MAAGGWVWGWGRVGRWEGGRGQRAYVRAHPLTSPLPRSPPPPPPPHTQAPKLGGKKKKKKTTKLLCKPACILPKRQNETSSHLKVRAQQITPAPAPPPREKERKKQKGKGSRPFHKATTPDSLATVQILRVNSASLRDIHARAKKQTDYEVHHRSLRGARKRPQSPSDRQAINTHSDGHRVLRLILLIRRDRLRRALREAPPRSGLETEVTSY